MCKPNNILLHCKRQIPHFKIPIFAAVIFLLPIFALYIGVLYDEVCDATGDAQRYNAGLQKKYFNPGAVLL